MKRQRTWTLRLKLSSLSRLELFRVFLGVFLPLRQTIGRNLQHHLTHTDCHRLRKMVEVKWFWCIPLDGGPNDVFAVNIGLDQSVFDLKVMIKASLNRMRQYDAQDIPLYKASTFQAKSILCSSIMVAKRASPCRSCSLSFTTHQSSRKD